MESRTTLGRTARLHSLFAFAVLLLGLVIWLGAADWEPNRAVAAGGKGDGGKGDGGHNNGKRGTLRTVFTGRRAELRPTVPIADHVGQRTKSVLSVGLPRLKSNQRIRFNGEVTISTTCVDQISRCIGRSYDFDPHLRAQIVLARRVSSSGGHSTKAISRAVSLTCEQTRPNRNHHCPMTIGTGSFMVNKLRKLPCKPTRCRLNMILDATSHAASSHQFVVVGSDQPNGGVEGGKARLSAVVSTGKIVTAKRRTTRRIHTQLPPSFEGGKTVTYSQRLDNLRAGDVLLVHSVQRSAIQHLPYFISNQIVISTKRDKPRPSGLTRRITTRSGLASETTGFNCTLGSSAFQSPCTAVKVGMARIESIPKDKAGKHKPLYVNLVSRGFPKLAQGRYAPVDVLAGGSLTVKRLRVAKRKGGKGGHGGGKG